MASSGHTHASGGGYHGGVGAIISVEEVTKDITEVAIRHLNIPKKYDLSKTHLLNFLFFLQNQLFFCIK